MLLLAAVALLAAGGWAPAAAQSPTDGTVAVAGARSTDWSALGRLYVNNGSGNVGIGTFDHSALPAEKLDIQGNTKLTGSLIFNRGTAGNEVQLHSALADSLTFKDLASGTPLLQFDTNSKYVRVVRPLQFNATGADGNQIIIPTAHSLALNIVADGDGRSLANFRTGADEKFELHTKMAFTNVTAPPQIEIPDGFARSLEFVSGLNTRFLYFDTSDTREPGGSGPRIVAEQPLHVEGGIFVPADFNVTVVGDQESAVSGSIFTDIPNSKVYVITQSEQERFKIDGSGQLEFTSNVDQQIKVTSGGAMTLKTKDAAEFELLQGSNERLKVHSNGNLVIDTPDVHSKGTLQVDQGATFNDQVAQTDVTESTSPTTGAFVTAGGLGVAKDAFFGASVSVATDQDIQGALSVFYGITVNGDSAITSDTAAESTATAALTVTGGVGVGESMYLGKDLKVLGESDADPLALDAGSLVVSGGVTIAKQAVIGSTVTANADVAVLSNAAAATNNDAALTINGGVGIGKNAIIAGTVDVEDTTDSINSTSGAVTVAGGLGVAGASNFGSKMHVEDMTQSMSTTTGSITTKGGMGIAKDVFIGGSTDVAGDVDVQQSLSVFYNLEVAEKTTIGAVTTVTDTTDADFLGVGSVRTSGGLSVGLKTVVGGTVTVLDATDAASLTAASLTTAGGLGVGKDAKVGGDVEIKGTTQSTSSSTGSLTTDGGLGVALDAFIDGELTVGGKLTVASMDVDQLTVNGTDDSTSSATGALTTLGGMGVAKSLSVGDNVVVEGTTDSTSVTTGSLRTAGGLGVAKDAYLGGSINVAEDATVTGALTVENTTVVGTMDADPASLTAGSVVIAGGVSVAKQAVIGSTVTANADVAVLGTDPAVTNSNATLTVGGGVGIGKNAIIAGTVEVEDTTASADSASGAVTVAGGLGVAGASNFGSKMHVEDMTQSMSTTTGSITTKGGMGIAKDVFIGGSTDVAGDVDVQQSLSVFYNLEVAEKTTIGAVTTVTDTTDADFLGVGSVRTSGGLSVGLKTVVGGTVTVLDATDAASLTAASLTTAGGLGVGKDAKVGGDVEIKGTTQSTSSSTGSLTTDGGLGVALDAFVDGSVTVGEDLTVTNVTLRTGGALVLEDAEDSTGSATGSITTAGGLGVAKAAHIGGEVVVEDQTNSMSVTTGSIHTAGGLGVKLDTFIGGALDVNDDVDIGGALSVFYNLNVAQMGTVAGQLKTTDTTDSTDVNTAALASAGGLSVKKSSTFGGTLNVLDTTATSIESAGGLKLGTGAEVGGVLEVTDTTAATDSATASAVFSGGVGVAGGVVVDGVVKGNGLLEITDDTEATSITDASVTTAGGLGVAKQAKIGGSVEITDSGAANSTATGSFVTAGGLGVAKNVITGGTVKVEDTSQSYSTSTGAITTLGGLGVKRDAFFGASVDVAVDADIQGSLSVFYGLSVAQSSELGGTVTVTDLTDSMSKASGSVVTAGGLGVGLSANVGGTLSVKDVTDATSTSSAAVTVLGGLAVGKAVKAGGTLEVTDTTESTGTTAGAVTTAGGVGVAKNLNVGGAVEVDGTVTSNDRVIVTEATEAANSTSGSVTTAGGLGVAKNVVVGGTIKVDDTTQVTGPTSASVITDGGVYVAKDAVVAGNADITGNTDVGGLLSVFYGLAVAQETDLSGVTTFHDFTDASTVRAASVVMKGGLGVGKKMVLGGTLTVNDATEATSTYNAAVTVSGGVGVAKDAYVGGSLYTTSLTTSSGEDLSVSSMGKIDVTSNNEEEIALVHDSVKRVHVQSSGKVKVEGKGVELTGPGDHVINAVSDSSQSPRIEFQLSGATRLSLEPEGAVHVNTSTNTDFKVESGGGIRMFTAADHDFYLESGGGFEHFQPNNKDFAVKVAQQEIFKYQASSGSLYVDTNEANGTSPRLYLRGQGINLNGRGGSLNVNSYGINIQACGLRRDDSGNLFSDCTSASFEGTNVMIKSIAANQGKVEIQSTNDGGEIDIKSKNELSIQSYGNDSSGVTITAGHDSPANFLVQQEQAVLGTFFASERMKIDSSGGFTVTHLEGSKFTVKMEASASNQADLTAHMSLLDGYMDVLKVKKTLSSSAWATVARVTMDMGESAFIEVFVSGGFEISGSTKPAAAKLYLYAVHFGGADPEPDGTTRTGAMNNTAGATTLTSASDSYLPTSDYDFIGRVVPENSGSATKYFDVQLMLDGYTGGATGSVAGSYIITKIHGNYNSVTDGSS